MIRPNLFYFLSVPFFHSFSLLIRAGNLANTSGAEQHHHAMSRHATPTATPSPRSEQLRTHEQHDRTVSGRTPTATPSPTSRATFTPMSNHTPERHPVRTPRPQHHYTAGLPHIDKPNLTASIPMGNSAAEAFFRSRFVQNHKLL